LPTWEPPISNLYWTLILFIRSCIGSEALFFTLGSTLCFYCWEFSALDL
jgi:hypothetical protein